MSLWTRPRWWTLPRAAAMPMREAQEAPHLHRRAEQPVERLAARILEHQHGPTVFAHELQRPRRPCAVQLILQPIFVSEAIEDGRWRVLRGGRAPPARRSGVPSAPRRHPRQKTRSPSSHKTWKLSSIGAEPQGGIISRTPPLRSRRPFHSPRRQRLWDQWPSRRRLARAAMTEPLPRQGPWNLRLCKVVITVTRPPSLPRIIPITASRWHRFRKTPHI